DELAAHVLRPFPVLCFSRRTRSAQNTLERPLPRPVVHLRLLEDGSRVELLIRRILARATEEARVEAAEWCLIPGDPFADVVDGSLVVAGTKDDGPSV